MIRAAMTRAHETHGTLAGGTSPLDRIRIVLVEPTGPRNVGAAARVMKNFGLRRLVVVNGPPLDLADCCAMAASAIDVLHGAETPPTLADAIAGCGLVVGTTGRVRARTPVRSPRESAHEILHSASQTDVAILFGREDDGLHIAELRLCQSVLSIDTAAAYRSLNVAQAVGVVAHEIFSVSGVESVRAQGRIGRFLDANWRGRLEDEIFRTMESLGSVTPRTKDAIRNSVRRVLSAGPIQTRDARVLFSLARRARAAAESAAAKPARPEGKPAKRRPS